MKSKLKVLGYVFFGIYIGFLVWAILFKFGASVIGSIHAVSFIPFAQSGRISASYVLREIIANFLVFMPFGFFLRLTNKGRFFINALIMLGTSILFEIIQYVLAIGVADTTDVLLNTVGGIAGYWLTHLIFHIPFKKLPIALIIIAGVAAAAMIVWGVLLIAANI